MNGIPREVVDKFLCTDYQPPSADEPDMERRKIKNSRRINTMKDAMVELQRNPKQPIGADLISCLSLYNFKEDDKEIYYGPKSSSQSANVTGYHAVVIEEFRKMKGDVVAVCKLSNGVQVGDKGYIYVSATTQYLPVAVSEDKQEQVRGSKEPLHLLSDFIVPEMDAKEIDKEEEEKDIEEDKEEDDAKKDDEPAEKELEDDDYVDYVSVEKRPRLASRPASRPRYLALNMLMKAAIAFNDQAVQRQRVTILEYVKDSDASIRKRALELVSLLVNENNVKQVTKELTDYLEISDEDFKEDLSAKICSIVEKFSPEKIWYIDQVLKVLSEAGKFVKDDVWQALIVVISNASELHGYTVRALYKAVLTYSEQETLVRVAIWCIGEYGDLLVNNVGMLGIEDPITITECDAVDIIEDAITRHNSDMTTKAMALVALLKLSSRFPSISERIKDIIVKQKGSLLLEMQQSAIQFNSIVDRHKNIRSPMVEKTPVLDEATFNVRRAGSLSVDNQIMPDFEQVLHAKALSFIGDKSVNLSWNEATKLLPSTTTLGKRPANGAGNNVGSKKGRVQSHQFVNKAF